ncbi:MAG: hypothetical protein U9R49_10085 [Bacteroidota bacterium]|nr:hypothetical protein [Bacteroidota bacterium]
MKRIIIKYFAILSAVLLVSSCEWNPPTFDSADSFIAYTASGSLAAEQGGAVAIPILVTAESGAPSVSVTFDFDESSVAIEGEDFTLVNPSNTLEIPDGWGYDTIWIQPIDNDVFTGNIPLIINLTSNTQNYPFGVTKSHTLTIVDDEHPLGNWIGSFTVSAVDYSSYFGPETWTVTTAPDPSDVNNLIVTGIGSGYSEWTSITGVVDLDAETITFSSGAEIGTHADYGGPLAIYLGDADGNLYEEPIVGAINADGSIYVDMLGIQFVGGINEGLTWGVYETTWAPAKKKSVRVATPATGPAKELKLQQ